MSRAVAVLEVDHAATRRERAERGDRRVAIVGMDEVEERRGAEFVVGVSEHALPRGIEPQKVAVEVGHAEQIQREVEEALELIGSATAFHVDANQTADGGHRRQILGRHLHGLAAEELHHRDDPVVPQDRNGDRPVKARAPCRRDPGQRRVELHAVHHDCGPGGPDPARHADAAGEGGRAADVGELREWARRIRPGAETPEGRSGTVDAPEPAVLPAERRAQHAEDAGHRAVEGRRFGQLPRDRVRERHGRAGSDGRSRMRHHHRSIPLRGDLEGTTLPPIRPFGVGSLTLRTEEALE